MPYCKVSPIKKKKKKGAMTQLLGHLHREQISGTNAYFNLVEKAR